MTSSKTDESQGKSGDSADFDPNTVSLHAFDTLRNHDSEFDGQDTVQWAKKLSNQVRDAFQWDKKD